MDEAQVYREVDDKQTMRKVSKSPLEIGVPFRPDIRKVLILWGLY